jgi:hypothetical protein
VASDPNKYPNELAPPPLLVPRLAFMIPLLASATARTHSIPIPQCM